MDSSTLQPFLSADLDNAFTSMAGSIVPSDEQCTAAINALSSTRGNFFFASAGSTMYALIPELLQPVTNLSYSATRSFELQGILTPFIKRMKMCVSVKNA